MGPTLGRRSGVTLLCWMGHWRPEPPPRDLEERKQSCPGKRKGRWETNPGSRGECRPRDHGGTPGYQNAVDDQRLAAAEPEQHWVHLVGSHSPQKSSQKSIPRSTDPTEEASPPLNRSGNPLRLGGRDPLGPWTCDVPPHDCRPAPRHLWLIAHLRSLAARGYLCGGE
ncbi:hypothetical protein NDU88_005776 [Pleurodeles waltl]|uniref:Uncharacterized protein n=1 Tax=Pleurodeles waltl TaxID=8319 RepID=A0AAV7NNF5_PLEWA|nr:hypothetical protein NDU88_005776 [Pleurodeles waltl]